MKSWLSAYSGILSIRGADANSFLQGQFTNDLGASGPIARYGLWLDHKGKAQADSFVLRLGENDFLAVSGSSNGAAIRAHLEKYIVADEVSVDEVTGDWVGWGAWGEDAATFLRDQGMAVPAAGTFARHDRWLAFAGRRSGRPNYEILVPRAELPPGAERATADAAERELERIRSGIPAVPQDIGPGELPNEGGLDAVAISYTKGCFTGQEVMARLKNLGQIRRRLFVVRGEGAPPAPGTSLYQGETRVGETRSAARDGEGFVALALLSLVNLKPDAGLALAPGQPAALRLADHG
jgi:tRNA-modifying protein YgfZ